jgi:hypothetical protein
MPEVTSTPPNAQRHVPGLIPLFGGSLALHALVVWLAWQSAGEFCGEPEKLIEIDLSAPDRSRRRRNRRRKKRKLLCKSAPLPNPLTPPLPQKTRGPNVKTARAASEGGSRAAQKPRANLPRPQPKPEQQTSADEAARR